MKRIFSILKIVIPFGIAAYLFYFTFKDPEKNSQLFLAFSECNYYWILLSVIIGWLSHLIRSYRWNYLLKPIGIESRFWNNYHAVMIGYIINMTIPRAGEASRALALSKYETAPFDKIFGTVVAERIVDMLILLGITAFVFFTQADSIWFEVKRMFQSNQSGDGPYWLWVAVLVIVLLLILGKLFLGDKIIRVIKSFLAGIFAGLTSLFKQKNQAQFWLCTLGIWVLYVTMFWVCFYSMKATSGIAIPGIFTAFVFGSFAVVVTPGGTGAYHIAVGIALMLFGVDQTQGEALGLVVWTSQVFLVIVLGIVSLFLMPRMNRNVEAAITKK